MRVIILILVSFLWLVSCTQETDLVDETNTQLTLVNGVLYLQNNPFSGLLFSRYANESLKKKLAYVDGRKDGLEKQWHPNGKIAQNRFYKAGVKIGKHEGWWEDGTKKFEYQFNKNGAYDGSRKEWYQNGQLVLDFNYTNGKELGRQRMWTSNGKIRANYEVKNGERFGLIGLKKCFTVNTDSNVLQ